MIGSWELSYKVNTFEHTHNDKKRGLPKESPRYSIVAYVSEIICARSNSIKP
jgi:hypothetical protein